MKNTGLRLHDSDLMGDQIDRPCDLKHFTLISNLEQEIEMMQTFCIVSLIANCNDREIVTAKLGFWQIWVSIIVHMSWTDTGVWIPCALGNTEFT